MATETYGKKDYLQNEQIHFVRQMYKSRFMMQPFAGNFSHDRRFENTDWLCRCRREKEDETHLLSGNCEVYGEIRKKYGNIDDDKTMVEFFNEVLAMRDLLEDRQK